MCGVMAKEVISVTKGKPRPLQVYDHIGRMRSFGKRRNPLRHLPRKARLKGRIVTHVMPETPRSMPDQGEAIRKGGGGPKTF